MTEDELKFLHKDELKFLHKDVNLHNKTQTKWEGGGRKQKTTLSPPGKKHKIKSLIFSFAKKLES